MACAFPMTLFMVALRSLISPYLAFSAYVILVVGHEEVPYLMSHNFIRHVFTSVETSWVLWPCHFVLIRAVAKKFSIGGLCFSAGGLWVCVGGLTLLKLTKSHLIYSVSCVNLGGLGALFGGEWAPKILPVAMGLVLILSILLKLCEHM